MKKYYEAYDERYKAIHAKGYAWASVDPTPIVLASLRHYGVSPTAPVLEIGCGEGRDARAVLAAGYDLRATDVSPEAISYCRATYPQFAERFSVLDCVGGDDDGKYAFIYAVAVLHMLVLDEDRSALYAFIRSHLRADGVALICTMGDGEHETCTDHTRAFELQPRKHASGEVMVANTSCRMVSFDTFRRELAAARLEIAEEGMTACMPEFDSLLYAVVRVANSAL